MNDISTAANEPALVAKIAIRRTSDAMRDRFRAYRIVIDGQPVAKIKRGQSHEVDVAPGPHSVQLTIDWCTSREAYVDLRAGDRVAFVCKPSGSPATAIPSITIGRNFYIALEPDS